MEEWEEGEDPQGYYMNRLHRIQQNESNEFYFGDDYDDLELQWTIEQWNELFTELLTKNTVETIIAGIQVCPVEAFASFTDYVRSTKNIKNLTIKYEPEEHAINEKTGIPANYRSKIDDILAAVRGNPAIKRLTLRCLGNPQSIQDLLTGNASLETFNLRLLQNYHQISKDTARFIVEGLKANKKLKDIGLFVNKGHLDMVCSGLCHREDDPSSCLESLSLWTNQPESIPELGPRVLEAIKCCPSLKTLTVKKPDYWWGRGTTPSAPPQAWMDYILKNLHHPEYASLETLRLEHITLGTNHTDTVIAPDWVVPDEQGNKTLKDVTLEKVTFGHESTVLLLYNLRGLMRLHVEKLSYLNGRTAENANEVEVENNGENDGDEMTGTAEEVEGDERDAAEDVEIDCLEEEEEAKLKGNEVENNSIDYWEQFIRQCTHLRTAHFYLDDDMDFGSRSRMLESVLKGARGHAALEELTLRFYGVQIQGGRLRSLLQQILLDTVCLRELQMDDIRPHKDLAAGLAGGLRGNKSLQKLVFRMFYTEAGRVANYIRILDSLSENHTLQNLSDETSYYTTTYQRRLVGRYRGQNADGKNQAICEAFARLFQVNNSLSHIMLPGLNLRGQMGLLLESLVHNTTLKSVDMSNCQTDAPGFLLLAQSLVDNPVERIVLPYFSLQHTSGLSTELKYFFHCLVRMRRIKTVDFNYWSWPVTEDEDRVDCLKLLVRAAKENKYIQSFGSDLADDMEVDDCCRDLLSDIDYYLKLNRFGRHGLDSRNLRRSLWPAILAPISVNAEDADALFFFIREYYMRHSYPLRWQREQKLRLPKRARMDEDSDKKKAPV